MRIMTAAAPDEQGATISFIRAVFDVSANRYGYIEVQSDYKKLDEICNINHIGNVFLLNDKGDIVYPSSSVSAEESGLLKRNLAQKNKSGVFSLENHMYFYASSDYSGITTYIQYPKDTIYSSMKLLQHTTIIFFCVRDGCCNSDGSCIFADAGKASPGTAQQRIEGYL